MDVVTTEEAVAFVERAMRNWDDLRFDTDDLEDLRLALGQFLASHTKPAVTLYCSFCGKSQYEVRKLVAGLSAFICNECTDLSHDLCHEDAQAIEAGTGETPSGSIRQDESAIRKDAP